MAGLLRLYPKGRGPDGYKEMMRRLRGEAKIGTSRSTLARVLSQMPDKWRENR